MIVRSDRAMHSSQKVWSFSTLAVVTKKVRLSEGNLSLLIRWLGLLLKNPDPLLGGSEFSAFGG